jgi:membrane-bound metal-dependent hydrolase YbcI (DUF457 family)
MTMFATGHLALGYIVGKLFSRVLNKNISLPLIFFFSIFPDIDLLIIFLTHRGPTHSIIVMAIVSVPFLIHYGERALPYLLATAQHTLIGDFLTGGAQIFWPINNGWIGLEIFPLSQANVILEWIFFASSLFLMFKTKDIYALLRPNPHNLFLLLPVAACFLPIAGFILGFRVAFPVELILPNAIYALVLLMPILNGFLVNFGQTPLSRT